MAMLCYCIPCQDGDHGEHYEVVEAVPEGVIGGAICPCKGECRNFPKLPPPVPVDLPELDPEVSRLLSEAAGWERK